MFCSFAALALAALVQIAHANPLAPVANTVKPTSESVTTAANFPIRALGSVAGQPNITLGTHGIHADAAEATFNPATLLLCPGLNCLSCSGFDLSTIPVDECLLTSAFNSMAISQPANTGLPFAVDVTNSASCLNLIQIPVVNECFNVATGGPFVAFAVVE